jgi:hypothetical protein
MQESQYIWEIMKALYNIFPLGMQLMLPVSKRSKDRGPGVLVLTEKLRYSREIFRDVRLTDGMHFSPEDIIISSQRYRKNATNLIHKCGRLKFQLRLM